MSGSYIETSLNIDEDVATVAFNRPDALNAITPSMLAELNAIFREISASQVIRFIILTGNGRAFSAGVDLKALGARRLEHGKVGDILDLPARELTEQISTMRQPVIARVNGFCFTGALEIALACDLIAVAEEARLGDTHAQWALRPTWGMSQRLPRRVGIAKARELSLTARSLTGADAVSLGIANLAAPLAELDQRIEALIAEMRPNSDSSFAAYKNLYLAAEKRGLADGLRYEADSEFSFDTDETESRLAAFRK